ncbi:hypothetical protein VI03_15075 [Burkholderia vietnamiensis]|nr:hypothetical protein VI03_15075 [Burkholderia vietnamiensis]KVM56810.1 hypothetical protein WJ57_07360 [Burkholderia vietnamiensis]KVS04383.1 hypothetical protein WK30_09585 [Burkholderia vietnamiensis]
MRSFLQATDQRGFPWAGNHQFIFGTYAREIGEGLEQQVATFFFMDPAKKDNLFRRRPNASCVLWHRYLGWAGRTQHGNHLIDFIKWE